MSSQANTASRTAPRQDMIHPDLLSDIEEGALDPHGRRLTHAEGTSRAMRSKVREPQPRGARIHGSRPVDQSEAAARFISATEHEKMHDERLWDLRRKRDRLMHNIEEWEELRELASQIKQHTLAHLDEYLEEFEAAATANGVIVHWAADAAEHNRTVHGIARSRRKVDANGGVRHALLHGERRNRGHRD